MPLDKSIQKVLVIGSGPIVIGQAAEFDYAGAQACRVLKDAGVNVVLCNSNPATIMTDQAMADEIYLEPLTVETVKRIIKKERPDSILAGLGGQTGLTLAMQLDKEGFLQEQGVRLLGTDAAAISRAEDRELFKEAMAEIGQPVIASDIAETVDERPGGGGADRLSRHRASRLYPGRRRRRRGQRRRRAADHRRHRPGRLAHHADSGGEGHLRLEGDRV